MPDWTRCRFKSHVLLLGLAVVSGCADQPYGPTITDPQLTSAQAPTGSPSFSVIPGYSVHFIGEGYPRAINELGEAAGWVIAGGVSRAWASSGGATATLLPLPAGATFSRANDLNDRGVVVGCAGFSGGDRATAWYPENSGYSVVDLGSLPGTTQSCATGVNDLDDVVGFSVTPGWSGGPATFFTDPSGLVNLSTLGFAARPEAINDQRQVVGGSYRMDLDNSVVENLSDATGSGSLTAINEFGGGAGWVAFGCCSNPPSNLHIVRYGDVEGWEVLSGSGRYTYGYGINDNRDVVGEASLACAHNPSGSLTGVVYLQGLGLYCLSDLLHESERDWAIGAVFTNDINNAAQIAVTASNSVTGEYGTIILTANGPLPAPGAPGNLAAVPHVPTWQQPWNAITLTWDDPGRLDTGFRIERRIAGSTGPWTFVDRRRFNSVYWDTTVDLGVTYDYRVVAEGLGGDSPPSNTATATAPGTPVDTEDPSISITDPADGSTVSGSVAVVMVASDNVGLTNIELRVSGNYLNQVVCSEAPNGVPSLTKTCTWRTNGVEAGDYQLEAYASDAIGNGARSLISVRIGPQTLTMSTSAISLSARLRKGVVNVTGGVSVVDQSGSPLKSASVYATWTLPDGTIAHIQAYTDRKGVAKFSTAGVRGTYTLTVDDVIKTGYTFDRAGSVLSRSITR